MDQLDYRRALQLDGRGFVLLGAGGGGIGTQTALAVSQCGAELLLVDVSREQAEEAARLTGGEAFVADILDRAQMQAVFDRAVAKFGERLFGIVDVVGVVRRGDLLTFDEQGVDEQFDIVLKHVVHAIQIGGPLLAANGGGSMIFVGSLAGHMASGANAWYGSAKAALHHLVRYAAREFGPRGVRANVVAPGITRTPRVAAAIPDDVWAAVDEASPLGRAADPSDIARAILFLASDLATYVTGNVLMLDAGVSNNVNQPHHRPRGS